MCQVSSTALQLFTDAEACYVGRDLRYYTCWCPISTCAVVNGQQSCQFTLLTVIIVVISILVGVFGLVVYLIVTHQINETLAQGHAENPHYRDVLFGVYDASGDTKDGDGKAAVAETPHQDLIRHSATRTDGGTFSAAH